MTIDPDATSEYRLKSGCEHVSDGRPIHGGDIVVLTNRQFAAFRDRFELVMPVVVASEETAATV